MNTSKTKTVAGYVVILLATVALMLIFALPAGAASPIDLDTNTVTMLTNSARNANGVLPLFESETLSKAAAQRAKEAATQRSHIRPDGTPYYTTVTTAPNTYVGENLAGGSYTSETVVTAWMNSAGHRENILDPEFHYIGVGYYVSETGTIYWCELFSDTEY
jgi:uncharacterized protein YkwD|nr:MAG TPA: PRY1 protein [Bacteriophage sp.]